MDNLTILSLRDEIDKSFNSLIKSGRPDICDEQNNSLVPKLYVDLFENDYILKQVLNENHVILNGRKGTGKSTVFLQAENSIAKMKNRMSVYINLQSCYEEIRMANNEQADKLTRYRLYYNFFNEVLIGIKNSINKIFKDKELEELFKKIKDGEFIDSEFQRSMEVVTTQENETKLSANANVSTKQIQSIVHNQKK